MAYSDPYRVLGVNRDASEQEIKERYRQLAKKYHPDQFADPTAKQLAEERMAEINEAYDEITKAGFKPAQENPSSTYTTQNPWQSRQQTTRPRTVYYSSRGCCGCGDGCGSSNTLCTLCLLDSCCECMGGDLIPCC